MDQGQDEFQEEVIGEGGAHVKVDVGEVIEVSLECFEEFLAYISQKGV